MHRARLAEKAGAEMREHALRRRQHAKMPVGEVGVVCGMRAVFAETHGAGNFVRHLVDAHGDAEFGERRHHLGVKFGDRYRLEHDLAKVAVGRAQPQHVVVKVELDRKVAAVERDRPGAEAPRRDIERDMPGVIEP